MRKIILSSLFIFSLSNAEGNKICSTDIPDVVLYAVLNNECRHTPSGCDPFTIRINKSQDFNKAKSNGIFPVGPHVLCNNKEHCATMAEKLISIGINNIDLGPYQINYYWQGKYELSGYFDFNTAEIRAREILAGLINQHGYSWTTLARYHNYDPKNISRNQNYYQKMQNYIYGKEVLNQFSKQTKVANKNSPKHNSSQRQLKQAISQQTQEEYIVTDTYQGKAEIEYSKKQEAKLWSSGKVIYQEPASIVEKVDETEEKTTNTKELNSNA